MSKEDEWDEKRIAVVLAVISIIMVMGGIGSFALFHITSNQTDFATWTEVPITERQDGQQIMLRAGAVCQCLYCKCGL